MGDEIFRLPGAVRRDPRIESWFSTGDPLRAFVRPWFEKMRGCGSDVREILHDGHPIACAVDAAFGYVDAFKAHVSLGFFQGAVLFDPATLLEGSGKRMRHVKLRWGQDLPADALNALIAAAYGDVRERLKSSA